MQKDSVALQALPILRPLRLGELLDRAFRLYRGNFLTFIGMIALAYVPLMMVPIAASAVLNSSTLNSLPTPGERLVDAIIYILVLVSFLLVQGIATGALTRAVADTCLGKQTSILAAYQGLSKPWLTLVGALLLLCGSVIVILIWWIVPLIGWFTGLGMVLFTTTVINRLLPCAVILENQNALAAIKRAWSLARRRFWPVTGYTFILFLFGMIVQMGTTVIIGGLLSVLPFDGFFEFFSGLISLVFILLYSPLQSIAFTLIYFDLRVRTEGLDLALLTGEASSPVDISQAMLPPPPPADERLITWPELGYFAILTPVGVIIYTFFYPVLLGSLSFLMPITF